MTTMKTFLVVGSCGLVLWGAMVTQAMGLSSVQSVRWTDLFRVLRRARPPVQRHLDWAHAPVSAAEG